MSVNFLQQSHALYGILYLISENQARYGYVVCWVFILMASIGINFMDKILRRILLYGKDK